MDRLCGFLFPFELFSSSGRFPDGYKIHQFPAEKKTQGNTISRKLSAISWVHKINSERDPTSHRLVRESLRGAKKMSFSKIKKAYALKWETIQGIKRIIPDTPRGRRDKLVFLLGFAGALRRDEIRHLKIDDLHFMEKGLVMDIKEAKTAKEGENQKVVIPQGKSGIIPRLRGFIEEFSLKKGHYLFNGFSKSGEIILKDKPLAPFSLNRIIKGWCLRYGLDPEGASSHGLRRGFIAECVERGVPLNFIQAHSRHRVPSMILEYSQLEEGFENHAGKDFL